MRKFNDLSIKWRLALIMVALASLVSVSEILLFSVYDARTFLKNNRARSLTLAHIIGANSIPALLFKDRKDALRVLSSLDGVPSVRAAYLFDETGAVLAEYLRPGETLSVPVSIPARDHDYLEDDNLIVWNILLQDDKQVGVLYIKSDLEELKKRRHQELAIGVVTALTFFVVSLLLALWLQRKFTDPIAKLAGTMSQVARENNYSLRAPKLPADEFGLLGDGFNLMLNEIEKRGKELASYIGLLQSTNKELDQFVYVASHDLKAPLRAVDNLARMISREVKDVLPPEKMEYLELMHSRISRMERLFDDLLEYSRVGRAETKLEAVNITQLTQDVIDLIGPPKKFTFTVPQTAITIVTQKTPLEQVLRNLIGNAIKHHNRADGRINIEASESEYSIKFSVCDDGPGIPTQYHEKIFGMFQTIRPRDEVEGSGMGLALVKKIVENQGGTVWLSSKEGSGSCFFFTWLKQQQK